MLDTTYPHDKPQMLYWNVQSEIDGEATIEITYFTSGITWSADYSALPTRTKSRLSFDGFVRVDQQQSGEEYEDAQVRLVVGTINLVEKIAQLAQACRQRPSIDWPRRQTGHEVQGHARCVPRRCGQGRGGPTVAARSVVGRQPKASKSSRRA